MSHDTSCTNNGIITDGDTAEDGASPTNPNPVTNRNGLRNQSTGYSFRRIK